MLVQRGASNYENLPPSHPRIAITGCSPDQGGREGPIGCDPLEIIVLDGPEKITYTSTLLSNEEREHVQGLLLKTKMCSPGVTQIWSESIRYWPSTS